MIKKTAIIGMGALGILYGTHMIDQDGIQNVCYVMDSKRSEKYKNQTFYKNGTAYQMPVCDCERAEAADLVIVAVKYNGLASAVDTMKRCVGEHTIIMSVMNGISSEEIIADQYGKEHMIYTVAQGMDAMKFGNELTYTRMGELRIGAKEECQQKNLQAVKEYFDRIQMPYTEDVDIMHRIWGKFMLNVGVNQCCMAYETDYHGCLVPGEANRTMIAAMREVIVLARCEGVNIGEKDLNEYVDLLNTLSPEGMPSMRQDGLAHRPSEVEMFSGTILRLAKKHGILVPSNRYLYERVKELEAAY
ncbi:MAG: 2-dehydropantoate 2-reductase [Lachnospiraceae bacterium]|nr:2-dehydropantoate 2-reductase [Lachnospiraceae bacterium]